MRGTIDATRVSRWKVILVTGAVLLAASNAWAQKPAQGSKGNIQISLGSIKQIGDLPQLVAARLLAEAGYSVTFHELNGNDQMVQALLRGEADFGAGSMTAAMTATSKGADLKILFETVRLDYVLAAKSALSSVDQINGTPSPSATSGIDRGVS